MIWSAIVFYHNGRRSSNGYSLRTLTFLQRKGQMVSCCLRSKVDPALHSLCDARLTNPLFHRIGKNQSLQSPSGQADLHPELLQSYFRSALFYQVLHLS
jgi:hypothetical protein